MVDLQITLAGDTVMSRKLMVGAGLIKDFTVPLQASADALQKTFQLNFDTRGAEFGGWAPRKAQMRRGVRVDTWPLLEKTGALRGSFYSHVEGNTAVLGNAAPYFAFHQEGTRKMPKRVIMAIQEAQRVMIQKIFQQHIVDATRDI